MLKAHFFTLFGLSFLVQISESWNNAYLVFVAFVLSFLLWKLRASASGSNLVFATTLLFSIIHYTAKLPHIANHANHFLLISLCLLAALLSQFRKWKTESSWHLKLAPLFCYSSLLLYFWTVFHKLNHDFFDPQVSCANYIVEKTLFFFSIDTEIAPFLRASLPYAALIVEALIFLFLLWPQSRYSGLLLAFALHLFLSLSSFFDFASIMIVFNLFFFEKGLRKSSERSVFQYAIGVWFGVALSGVLRHFSAVEDSTIRLLQGASFIVAALCLYRPVFELKCAQNETVLPTVTKLQFLVLLALFFHGLTPYMGFRTAGNFSMFSNLETQGETSNHLLLSSNPIKVSQRQDEVVWFLGVDKRVVQDRRQMPNPGYGLPKIEFKRLIRKWKREGYEKLQFHFEYQGQETISRDIYTEALFQEELGFIEKHYMLFRGVPRTGPSVCLW